MSTAIEFHHSPPTEGDDVELTAIVYLADLLCRLRGFGYGYYEAREFDLGSRAGLANTRGTLPRCGTNGYGAFYFRVGCAIASRCSELVDSILAGRPQMTENFSQRTHVANTVAWQ